MSRSYKILLVAVGLVAAVFLSMGLMAATMAYEVFHSGVAVVSVHEGKPHGTNLWLPVPVGLVQTALAFTPHKNLPPLDPEARRWLPVARRALAEIDKVPDAVFVDVTSGDEHVVVAKRDGRLVVDVHSRGDEVHVSLPPGALQGLLASMQDWPAAPTCTRVASRHVGT